LINTNSEFAKLNHIIYFPSPLLMLAAGKNEHYMFQTKAATQPPSNPHTAEVT